METDAPVDGAHLEATGLEATGIEAARREAAQVDLAPVNRPRADRAEAKRAQADRAQADRAGGHEDLGTDWHRRVVTRSLQGAQQRSIDRGNRFIRAAAKVLERSNGESLTVQDVAEEAGQSLRTLYQYFASKDDLLLAVLEEAMRTYTRIIRAAVAHLDDPLEQLAGAILAAAHLPAMHNKAGVDRGLARLRLQLRQADPDLIARSQAPVTALYRELVEAALADTTLADTTPASRAPASRAPATLAVEPATYLVASTQSTYLTAMTVGNEYGIRPPDRIDLSVFCLNGIGILRTRSWHEDVDGRLKLSGDGRSILRRLARTSPAD
ncbi:hypothetical protein FAIPA1_30281 [Frankia sp. AiPs1]|uniref:TetR/AcrR family transcriptional regulator n=1 Tax=Frankia sp. AiPa1 TaxID=573492 RepID=UPI00202B9B3C|nr:TetR/AcrR family transcriptional regulator [Frankia sp. AiPa1]MCL9759987.1 TetR/AcrR family transcriptional regulator [Frankia sp. AiPa1]